MVETKRICNGTFGEVWLDGSYVGECYKAQGKVEFNKEEIKQCGTWWTDNKVVGCTGKGSLTLYKVNTRMGIKIAQMIKDKKDIRFTVISKLADPDSFGAERVSLTGVSLMILPCLTGKLRSREKRSVRLPLPDMSIWIRSSLSN